MQRDTRLEYLLISHVPFGLADKPGRYLAGDMWVQDLRAQRESIERAGGKLVLACPCADPLQVQASGSFHLIEIDPKVEGFEYVPLPAYTSFMEWLRARASVRRTLYAAIERADIVHMGDGAHPITLDHIAWPIAGKLNKTRVWVYDGADVLPRLRAHADQASNAFKRMALRTLVDRREAFSRHAIRNADLIFAHNAAVVERFQDVWNERCYFFDRTFVTERALVSESDMRARAARLRDSTRPLRMVVAGRQILMKGTDQVIDAMALAAARGTRLELDVIGDGEDLDSFRAKAQGLGLADRVRFRGKIEYGDKLFAWIREADVMVIANLTPEISRNILLSMALGLPLVGYSNPGTDALLVSNEAGRVVPSGDVEALARALEALARDRESLVSMMTNGRRVAGLKTLEACHRERADLALDCARKKLGLNGMPQDSVRPATSGGV